MPRLDVRFRRPTDDSRTDRELFEAMPSQDNWVDARMHEVIMYIASNKHLRVPDSWQDTMSAYINQLKEQAPGTTNSH